MVCKFFVGNGLNNKIEANMSRLYLALFASIVSSIELEVCAVFIVCYSFIYVMEIIYYRQFYCFIRLCSQHGLLFMTKCWCYFTAINKRVAIEYCFTQDTTPRWIIKNIIQTFTLYCKSKISLKNSDSNWHITGWFFYWFLKVCFCRLGFK